MRIMEAGADVQAIMDSLGQQYGELEHESILSNYAFIPAHPAPISYVTANFLHGGWMHIIGKMWFLWLAGALFAEPLGPGFYPDFSFLFCSIAPAVFWGGNPRQLG